MANLELDSISHPWSFKLLPSPASHSPTLLENQITPSLLPSNTRHLSFILLSTADLPPSSLRRLTLFEGSFHPLPPVSHPLPPPPYSPAQHSPPVLGRPSPGPHPPAHKRSTPRLRILESFASTISPPSYGCMLFFPFATKLHQQAVHTCCFPFLSAHSLQYGPSQASSTAPAKPPL